MAHQHESTCRLLTAKEWPYCTCGVDPSPRQMASAALAPLLPRESAEAVISLAVSRAWTTLSEEQKAALAIPGHGYGCVFSRIVAQQSLMPPMIGYGLKFVWFEAVT